MPYYVAGVPVKAISPEMQAFTPPPCPCTDDASRSAPKARMSKPKSKGARVVEQTPPRAPSKAPPQETLDKMATAKVASPMPVPMKATPQGGLHPPSDVYPDIPSDDSATLLQEEEQYKQVINDCMSSELEGNLMPDAETLDKANEYARTREQRLRRKSAKHATVAAQECQDNALEVVPALRLPDQGYRQLMHSENNIVALETVLSFDSENDRDEICKILDTLSVGCEFDLENFTEEQMTLFIKDAQKVKHLLKWYYIAKS